MLSVLYNIYHMHLSVRQVSIHVNLLNICLHVQLAVLFLNGPSLREAPSIPDVNALETEVSGPEPQAPAAVVCQRSNTSWLLAT